MLKAILNKGGAGKSISRAETADRLSALMRRYNEIMFAYDAAASVSSTETADALEQVVHGVRDDVGKLSELILSAGAVPPLGTDIEPGDVSVGRDEAEALAAVTRLERAFEDALKGESGVKHYLRTIATLDNTLARTRDRIQTLERLAVPKGAAV